MAWIFREYSCLKKVGRSPLCILGQYCFERMMYYRVFSHDVTATILVSQNNETAAMFSGPTLNSIRQTNVDTSMIRTQSRVRVRVRVRIRVRGRVIYLNQTIIGHQFLGGLGVRVMHSRSDAHSILNCFFP